jgi:hypothetical protein
MRQTRQAILSLLYHIMVQLSQRFLTQLTLIGLPSCIAPKHSFPVG